jgi:hypothetical protein
VKIYKLSHTCKIKHHHLPRMQCSTCWRRVLGVSLPVFYMLDVSLSVFYMLETCAGCFIASVLHAGCFIASVLRAGDVCWVFL